MNYVVDNWSFDPFVVVVAVIVIVNELGLANLRRRSIRERSGAAASIRCSSTAGSPSSSSR